MLKEIALFFISPLNQALTLLAIALIIRWWRPSFKKTFRACVFTSVVWFYLCSQYFFSHLLIAPLEDYAPAKKLADMQHHDNSAIFVLACYYYDAPDMPLVSQWNDCSLRRLVQAYLMYKTKPQPILLTGGKFLENTDVVYANVAKEFLLALGVPEQDIRAIKADNGTRAEIFALQQAQYAFKHYYIVSSATHSFRLSKLMLAANLPGYTLFPVDQYNIRENSFDPSLPKLMHLERSEAAFYEYAAIVKFYFEQASNDSE